MKFRFVKNIRTFRNWYLPYAERYGLVGAGEVRYRLRNGTAFYARACTSDALTIKEIWVDRIYEPPVLSFPKGGTILDIGGHIGSFTAFAAARSPGARILAFEPEPENYRLLLRNLELNRLSQVRAFNLAIAAEAGERTFYLDAGKGHGGHSLVIPRDGGTSTVRCTTLARVLEENRIESIDYLKLGCEGAEFEILPALGEREWRAIRQIAMELHQPPKGSPADRLEDLIRSKGFEVHTEVKPGYLFARRPGGTNSSGGQR